MQRYCSHTCASRVARATSFGIPNSFENVRETELACQECGTFTKDSKKGADRFHGCFSMPRVGSTIAESMVPQDISCLFQLILCLYLSFSLGLCGRILGASGHSSPPAFRADHYADQCFVLACGSSALFARCFLDLSGTQVCIMLMELARLTSAQEGGRKDDLAVALVDLPRTAQALKQPVPFIDKPASLFVPDLRSNFLRLLTGALTMSAHMKVCTYLGQASAFSDCHAPCLR